MTLIVGILCKDGVVLASDSAAMMGPTLGQQAVKKLHKINDYVLYGATGAVGMAQLFAEQITNDWKELSKQKTPAAAMNFLGQAYVGLAKQYLEGARLSHQLGVPAATAICKSLIALGVGDKPQLITIEANGSPEHASKDLPFVAVGSGQPIADPFLAFLKDLLWKDSEPTLAEGRLVAVWAIHHVTRTNPGGVGGNCQLGLIERHPGKGWVANMVEEGEIAEHAQNFEAAEKALVSALRNAPAAPAPPIPQL